jgi:hypothetical protein
MKRLPVLIGAVVAWSCATAAWGQAPTGWSAAPATVAIDFRLAGPKREAVFLDDGFAYEIAVEFLLIGRDQVAIEAELGEPGEFRVESVNPAAMAKLKNVRVEGLRGAAEVEARVVALSRSDVTDRARQAIAKIWDPAERQLASEADAAPLGDVRRYLAEHEIEIPDIRDPEKAEAELRRLYLQHRTLNRVLPDFRLALEQFAERKPNWIGSRDLARWRQAEDHALIDDFHRLVEYEVKEEHLRRCGLVFESTVADFEAKIDGRFDAVYLAMSGKVGDDPDETRKMAQSLGPAELRRLRDALRVELRCRFYPPADERDPNSQWFHAQRIACQARDVASIRVEGRLDPARHDRVDWWALEGYDNAQVFFAADEAPGLRVDPPIRNGWIRVVATGDKSVDYVLRFRPREKKEGIDVVIYESTAQADVTFPY